MEPERVAVASAPISAQPQRCLELSSGAAGVVVCSASGGSIVTFEWRGTPVLRPTPLEALAARDVRRTASYPLIPYSNRIGEARLLFAHDEHRLARNFGDHPHAIHGVGWQRPWTVVCASATRAVLALEHDPRGDGAMAWPWPFRARQTFDLAADENRACLMTTLTIENAGVAPFPFGLGWHPFFPTDSTTTLELAAREVWLNDATQLPERCIAAGDGWSFRPPRVLDAMRPLDNVFRGFDGRAVLRSSARALTTVVEADSACRFVVVYAPRGRDFVAVEPVTHETDAFNRAAAGAVDTGARVLRPGEAFSCTMRLTVSDDA